MGSSKKVILFEFALLILFLIILGFVLFSLNSPFSVIVLPDIQKYSVMGKEDILFSQVNWIIENKNNLNIKFVVFEGDLVENWDNLSQWADANKAVSMLESNSIPFLLVPGNHDHDKTNPKNSLTNYSTFFPNLRFSNTPSFGGSFGEGNTYKKVRIGLRDYVFLGLDVCPTNDEIDWANKIFSENESSELILVTHGYLGADLNREVHVCGSTQNIWAMSKTHKNLQIILSGHVYGEATLFSQNESNVLVTQMLADYQGDTNGGSGYLRILEFVPSKGIVKVRTFSPFLGIIKEGTKSNFDFNYSFN
jgi:DNA repair exonuclease SbcCD nuclease subunit